MNITKTYVAQLWMYDPDWEECASNTFRLRVPGGWLVRVESGRRDDDSTGVSMTFVSDPEHSWEIVEVGAPVA